MDVTEIDGTDNLHDPQEMILDSQIRAAKVFGAYKTYFLVNGTTVGIQAMILGVLKPGDQILIPRNCHRSIWSALILGGLEPIYINPEVDPKTGLALSLSPQTIEEKLEKHPKIKAVVITYPTYYGTCCDMKKISEIIHRKNKLLLVDEAHGAHLCFNRDLPVSSLEGGADMVVQSTHKILSSLTQSSMLHIRNKNIPPENIELYLGMLQSSSPSYPLMASLDFATEEVDRKGKDKWQNILQWTDWARESINKNTSMKVKGKECIGQYHIKDIDRGKLWIDVISLGLLGTEVEKILRKEYKIQIELSGYSHILAMTGMGTIREDVEKLVKALLDIDKKYKRPIKISSPPVFQHRDLDTIKVNPRQAIYSKEEEVLLERSVGRISKEFIIPYPPGIPIVTPGEDITKEVIETIKAIKLWGGKIIGLQDKKSKKIKVIKEKI